MSDHLAEHHLDPRIRRTRKRLKDALQLLLEAQSFNEISITDICTQADIARVTFYQHYESKEALLLASVADFFANMYQQVDSERFDRWLKEGDIGSLLAAQPSDLADPARVRLIGVALRHASPAVHQLTTTSFLAAYEQYETELAEPERAVLATFYVGGILALLEQFLAGQIALSPQEFRVVPLALLHILRQGAIQHGILRA